MQPETIRTSIDLPRDLHRKLHEVAAKQGCSARQLILQSIEQVIEVAEQPRPKRRLNLDPPIIPSTGKPFTLENDQLYDIIEFP